MPMVTCPKCNRTYNVEDNPTCPSCGDASIGNIWKSFQSPHPLPKPKSDEWACPHCGGINPNGNPKCSYCGLTAQGAYMKFSTGKNVNVGIKAETPDFLKKGGREPPVVLPKGAGILSSIVGAVVGKKAQPIVNTAMDEIINYKQEEIAGEKRIEEVAKSYKDEEEKARRAEVEAEELQSKLTQEKLDRERRKSFTSGEKSFGGFWENVEKEAAGERGEAYKEHVGKMRNWEEDLDEEHTRCERCWNVYKKSEPFCPKCRFQNREYILPPGKMFCYYCKAVISVHDKVCPNCGKSNRGYLATEPLSKTTTKRISGKIYEVLIYELVGIFVTFGLPFFGLPSLPLLGAVIMALLPFYSFLPDERQVLSSRETGVTSLGGWGAGSLILKSSVKMTAFILTVIQFTFLVPVSKLIPLGICFAYYFTLPTYYKVTEPSKMIEAWFRLAVGGFIAWLMLGAFSYTSQAWTLAFMSAAFFVTSFPKHKEAEEEGDVVRVKIEILKKAYSKENVWLLEFILKCIFLAFMFAAAVASGIGFNFSSPTSIQIIFASVWALSVFTGWVAGSDGRPALGILMILITLFAFTFTATGVMGTAVFGYWWPQVESFGEAVVAPLEPIWEQVQTGMADSWLMLTNPAGYYDQMAKRQQATKTTPIEGGTVKSIEVTSNELFTSIPSQLDPRLDPLVGTMEVQNQGEFDAEGIGLTIWATWKDPTSLKELCTGSFYDVAFKCSSQASSELPPVGPGGSSGCNVKTCWWPSTTYPREIKLVSFVFNSGSGERTLADDANAWAINTAQDPNLNICTPDCDAENATYVHAGQTVKININISYSYKVNVSLPVEVIGFDTYRNLLQAKEITLQELTSQYTGGPVKATLWSQRQPIRGGETSLFVASIYNDGGGTIDRIRNFKIKIPNDLGTVEMVSSTFYIGAIGTEGCTQTDNVGGFTEINCEHYMAGHPLKAGEYKRVSFLVTPLDTMPVDRMTRLIIGLANYDYTKTTSKSITVANAPYH